MRVLIITFGTLGDLLPFLAVANALTSRGHDVSIASNSEFEPHVSRLGIDFSSVFASQTVRPPAEDARFWDSDRMWSLGWEHVIAPAMRPTYDLIRNRTQKGRCVVIANWLAFGARLAEEKLGVPLCTAYLAPEALNACDLTGKLAPRWRGFSEDEVFGPLLNAYRSELGLGPVDHICSHWLHSPKQGLALFPDWFCARQSYWPTQVTTTGFALFDDAMMPVPLQRLEEFFAAGDPPIAFTPGTGIRQAAHFFRESLAACASIGARAILLTPYRSQIPTSLPSWVLHLDYVPLHMILGRTAALVYHGGIGTCAQAIRAGVPHLVTPAAVDQFDNAERVQALGLGLSVPMKEYSERAITGKLTELLGAADTRRACGVFAVQFARENAIDRICEAVEGLA
jgi:rhamnosyltransferase subunit B